MKVFIIAATAIVLRTFAFGATITVHNTGVNASDALVAAGAQASFWTLSAEPAGATEAIGSDTFRYRAGPYFADTASAAWVAPTALGNAGALGSYTYDLAIDLTGLNPATASISGIYGTDNDGSISLDGNAPVATTGSAGFLAQTAFTINSGFTSGLNVIHVVVDNAGDPTAFFVQFNSATAAVASVPEPATLLLTGVAGLILALRRRFAK